MKRLINHYLQEWRLSPRRKPLILKGARQVGKTHAVRRLASCFENFVEINFELMPEAKQIFHKNLSPDTVIKRLSALTLTNIIPGKTLLFLDEAQTEPKSLLALRFFYEKIPELHVIAAGSLLDFALESVGVPVGRVSYLTMYPLSFFEFLLAIDQNILARQIFLHQPDKPMEEPLHTTALDLLGEYLAVGGMPEAILSWRQSHSLSESILIHNEIIDSYVDDFSKYARKAQVKYVDLIFRNVPLQLATQYRTYKVEGEFRKRELEPAIDLLTKAKVIQKIQHSASHGIPLGAQVDPKTYKLIILDIALAQSLLGLSLQDWITNPHQQYVNKGALVEAFIGQEILAYSDPHRPAFLYYWQRQQKNSNAEVDYIIEHDQAVVPVEVKSDKGTTLKSMRMFLETHKSSPYGIRFSKHDYSIHDKIHSYPLYAVFSVLAVDKPAFLHILDQSDKE